MLPSLGGGQQLGVARGSIDIDTSGLRNAVSEARRAGQEINRSLGGRAARGVQAFQRTVTSLRGELVALGAVGGLTTAFGLSAARDLRNYGIAFEQLLGSQQEATAVMEQLTEGANQYGLELTNVFALGRQLIPILDGNVDATEEWVKRAARLRTVFPGAQKGAELRAIAEFLSGQEMSLIRLFNIPPNLVQEAKAQFEDTGAQLDFILDKMGATEQAARDMANPITSIKNELRLIAAVGFEPLLMDLREILPEFREWLQDIRETRPEILKIGAALATAAAVGSPILLLLNNTLSTLRKIAAIGPIAALGKIGIVGAVGAIGAREGVQAIGRARDDERLIDITFVEMVNTALKALGDIFISGALLIQKGVQGMVNAFAAGIEGMGRLVQRIGEIIPDRLGGERLQEVGEGMVTTADEMRVNVQQFSDDMVDAANRLRERMNEAIDNLPLVGRPARRGFVGEAALVQQTGAGAPAETETGGPAPFDEEQMERIQAWQQFQDDLAQISADAQAEREAATARHEAQRTAIIEQYNKIREREEEDFQRRRRRENEQLQDDIAEIEAGRDERVEEIREEHNDRIAEIEEDAAKQRERMQEDHRDNLLSAAARLDAKAVAEEQRRFQRQSERFEEDLQDRINAEQDAHQERIQQAQEAAAERIANLREAVAERQRIEDEERRIRLERMEEDHEAQLAEMDEQHEARIQQIKDQERQERSERVRQFNREMIQLSRHYDDWLELQRDRQQDSLDAFEQYFDDLVTAQSSILDGTSGGFQGEVGQTGGGTDTSNQPSRQELNQMAIDEMQDAGWSPQAVFNQVRQMREWTDAEVAEWIEETFNVNVPGYQMGTPFVPRDMLAMLHRGEAVIDADTAEMMRRAAATFAPQQMATPITDGGRTINVASGAINIPIRGAPGQSPQDIGREVERALMRVFGKLGS